MGDHVRITKEGLLEFDYDPESQSYIGHAVAPDRIFATLRQSCKIDADVTLLDIFNIVAAFPSLADFMAQYSWCFAINEFHAAAKMPATSDHDDLERLEISRYIETSTYERCELPPDISDSCDFSGLGKADAHGHMRYGVSLAPMNTLAHLPVTLNCICDLRKNFEKISEWETTFSLLDVLDTIYYDISFHGGPADNEAMLQHLADTAEEIKSGRATLVPLSDIMDDDADWAERERHGFEKTA